MRWKRRCTQGMRTRRKRICLLRRWACLGVASSMCLAAATACGSPARSVSQEHSSASVQAEQGASQSAKAAGISGHRPGCQENTKGPTQFTIPPTAVNPVKVRAELRAATKSVGPIPDSVRSARMWLMLDRKGTVVDSRIDRSSGSARFDTVAQAVVSRAAFTPAYNGRDPVCLWFRLSVPVR